MVDFIPKLGVSFLTVAVYNLKPINELFVLKYPLAGFALPMGILSITVL